MRHNVNEPLGKISTTRPYEPIRPRMRMKLHLLFPTMEYYKIVQKEMERKEIRVYHRRTRRKKVFTL